MGNTKLSQVIQLLRKKIVFFISLFPVYSTAGIRKSPGISYLRQKHIQEEETPSASVFPPPEYVFVLGN
jgi:hypothetical protein